MTERMTPAALRAAAEAELKPLGNRRLKLLAQLEDLNVELAPVVIRAVEAEVSQRRISGMTGLSTTTIGKWSRAAHAP